MPVKAVTITGASAGDLVLAFGEARPGHGVNNFTEEYSES
jgi:hypothetical protein